MGIDDILTLPEAFEVEGKEYQSQFDCKSYGILEQMTGKSVYKIQDLIADNNLPLLDSIEVVCSSVIKLHTVQEVDELRKILMDKPYLITTVNMAVVQAFFKGIAPPEIFLKVKEIQGELKKIEEMPKKKVSKKKV